MFGGIVARLVSGAACGAAAGAVLSVARRTGESGAGGGTELRPIVKAAVVGAVGASERIRAAVESARASLTDLCAEAVAEQRRERTAARRGAGDDPALTTDVDVARPVEPVAGR